VFVIDIVVMHGLMNLAYKLCATRISLSLKLIYSLDIANLSLECGEVHSVV
jgi:hypothetical protein